MNFFVFLCLDFALSEQQNLMTTVVATGLSYITLIASCRISNISHLDLQLLKLNFQLMLPAKIDVLKE